MHGIRSALIVINTFKPEAESLACRIADFLRAEHIEPVFFQFSGSSVENPFYGHDLAITLGGDGTVLFAARHCARLGIPIFPVNLGEFGFIAGIERHNWEQPLKAFLNHELESAHRMLLEARVQRGGTEIFSSDLLNDAVVSGKGIAKIVNLSVQYDGVSFGMYKADGIIVATPTGSTAYSAASGGPILGPNLSALVLTPVSAFSLSNRPIVLAARGILEITVLSMRHHEAILTIDGQEVVPLQEGDRIMISESPHLASLIGCDASVFYSALRSKLNWSGAPVPECGGDRA